MIRPAATLFMALALAACGSRDALRPAAGESLPPKPAMAAATPTPDQLLTPTTQQQPERSEELLRRGDVRGEDRFDLPPQ